MRRLYSWPGVSFRARLRLLFALIVIVPMIALAVVLFLLTGRSETGKADAGIAAGLRAALTVYQETAAASEPALREVAADARLRAALERRGRGIEARMRELVARGEVVAIELRSADGQVVARAGPVERGGAQGRSDRGGRSDGRRRPVGVRRRRLPQAPKNA